MRIAVLGSGTVGRTLAAGTAQAGNDVTVGTRDVDALLQRDGEDAFRPWHEEHPGVAVATFAAAAAAADLVVNATPGAVSLQVLQSAGEANIGDKILVDVANPLDFSRGFPPSLTVSNTDSLAEQLQRAFPRSRVVKALNTLTASLMVDPGSLAGGEHDLPICGNDADAKATVSALLRDWFGWQSTIDLGDLTAARGMEAYLLLWVRMMGAVGTQAFNVRIVR